MDDFTRKGLLLEAKIVKDKEVIRKKSRETYGNDLLDSRLIMTSIIYILFEIKEGLEGKTSESISRRIHLIASYVQGIDITESSISEAQYMKATAIEKQNYEILTRIVEVKTGVAKEGQTPQVKNMPDKFRKAYGDLNKIAHPSNSGVIEKLVTKITNDNSNGVSYIPSFNKELSKTMYELHLIIMYNIILESIELLIEMYGDNIIKEIFELGVIGFLKIARDKLLKVAALNS